MIEKITAFVVHHYYISSAALTYFRDFYIYYIKVINTLMWSSG